MKKVNLTSIPVEARRSPKGCYEVKQKHVSLALGGTKDVGAWGGGHPFDVCEVAVPPGKRNWPFHQHSAQWELFLVKAGRGRVRTPEGWTEVGQGDCFMQAPGTPHQVENTGEGDLVLLVVADNPPSDIVSYPDTGQFFLKPQRKLLKAQELEFYENEE